jgi:flagellar motor switch protein FliM
MTKPFIPPREQAEEVIEEAAPEVQEELAAGTPRAFTFGAEAFRPMSALPALDRMSERMARRVREAIGSFARAKPRVTVQPVSIRRFEKWVAEQPEFTSLSIYRFRPLKNGVLVAIEPRFVSELVNAVYGGTRTAGIRRPDEFTPTEEQLLARLADAIMGSVTEVWSEVIPVQSQLMSRETNTAYAGLVLQEEPVAIARFNVTPLEGEPTFVDLLYPVAALRTVEAELSAKVLADAGVSAGEWHERMAAAVGQVRLNAHSVLARPTTTLSKLLALEPGDFIPVSLPKLAPLLVSGRVIGLGTLGEQNGQVALKIEKLSG